MTTRTMIEKSSLQHLAKRSMDKVNVAFNKKTIDDLLFLALGRYFKAKAPKTIVEEAFGFTASSLIKPDQDLLEHFSVDKSTEIITALNKNSKTEHNDNNDVIKIRVPLWQVIIITSDVDEQIHSQEDLVKSCMKATHKRLSVLFGE